MTVGMVRITSNASAHLKNPKEKGLQDESDEYSDI